MESTSTPTPVTLFYDFETNGQTPFHRSAIMQMAILSLDRSLQKNIYVHPYDGIVGATEIHGISSETLTENNAITSKMLMTYLIDLVRETYGAQREIHWIAYNNFGFDQLVMEHHFRVHGMKTPTNWLFVDLYPLISRYYPDLRKRKADGTGGGGYKLANVYTLLCPTPSTPIQWHTADADVEALLQIYHATASYHRHLGDFTRHSIMSPEILNDKISTLKGYAHYFGFDKVAATRIRHLYRIFHQAATSSPSQHLEAFLKDRVGIYSDFFRRQIVEQIEIIDEFQSSR